MHIGKPIRRSGASLCQVTSTMLLTEALGINARSESSSSAKVCPETDKASYQGAFTCLSADRLQLSLIIQTGHWAGVQLPSSFAYLRVLSNSSFQMLS